MKKILFIITKSNWGGAQRYVHDLAVGLPKSDFEAVAACGGDGPLAVKLRTAGVRVITVPSLERDISFIKELKSLGQLFKLIKSEKPDVLHINSSKAGVLGTFVGRLCFVPKVIFTSHGWAFNEDRPAWQKFIFKSAHWLTVLLAHKTIAVSHELKRQMDWPLVQNKMIVIHSGREIKDMKAREEARDFLTKLAPSLREYKNDFWSVTIGELHKIKQHNVTIRALAEAVRQKPNTRHIIIGEGEEREGLELLIKKMALESHIFLIGAVDEASLYLKAFDMFVLSSRSEALGYVIIEAAIAGLPIIATNVGGIPEIVDNGRSALLVPSGDVDNLKNAYLKLRSDEAARKFLAAGASERARHFTFAETLQKTMGAYGS